MKYPFCLALFLLPVILFGQNDSLKHDYIWLTGYSSNPTQLEFGGTVFDFHEDTLDVYYEYRDIDFNISNNTMSDENGELIFSSNGTVIANRLNEVMENGEGMNPESSAQQNILYQGILVLPSPNEDSTYFVLHAERTWIEETVDQNWTVPLTLYKSVVDMSFSSNNGYLGVVTEKNIPIIEDTLAFGRLTATRHANGRDWWILQQQYSTNKFYRFLLSPEGLFEQEAQIVGENQLNDAHGIGQAVFSPDGNNYCVYDNWNTLFSAHVDFFSFNRCTGLLDNFERLILNSATERPRGLAISSNSMYAYLATNLAYYQIDLTESPKQLNLIQERADTVSTPFLGQLAPNGKIYFCAWGAHREMHIIHNPNEEGIACNIEQGGLLLPTYNNGTIPNHPNYRLGRLIGSPCDTVYSDATSIVNTNSEIENFSISPNPTIDNINFSISDRYKYIITDWLGREIRFGVTTIGDNQVDVSNLTSGIYFISLRGDVPRVAKFIVQK